MNNKYNKTDKETDEEQEIRERIPAKDYDELQGYPTEEDMYGTY